MGSGFRVFRSTSKDIQGHVRLYGSFPKLGDPNIDPYTTTINTIMIPPKYTKCCEAPMCESHYCRDPLPYSLLSTSKHSYTRTYSDM